MRKKLSLLTALAVAPMLAFSQATPQHEKYVSIPSETVWASAYANWSPGTPLYQGVDETLAENENFFISRVKPRERFTFAQTQVRPEQDPSRKLLWWCPIGGDGWNAIPSYFFGGEVWGMWSYTDTWGNWTAPFITIPAAMLDACHKNGVRVSVCAPIAWAASISPTSSGWGSVVGTMVNGGHEKLLKYLQYYGVDGIGFNSEFSWRGNITQGEYSGKGFAEAMKCFLGDCYTEAPNYGVPFHNAWYSLTSNSGSMGGSSALNETNYDWFHYNGKKTSDAYMTNYGAPLSTSQNTVETYFPSRSSFDVYMGIDYQAGKSQYNWTILKNYNISIGIWGAHNRNMIYEARGERGSDPQQQQKTYQMILENVFTGSTKNPVNPPAVTSTTRFSSQSTDAYGWAQFITARSTLTCDDLSADPFVTYFNLGNGKFFNINGERQSDTEWYNLGLQDYLPTWRWWATKTYMGRDESQVSPDLSAEFTWDDAWFGGSCLQISGGTDQTYMQMFKTKYAIEKGDKLLIRYKVLSGNGKMEWACSTESAPSTSVEATIISNATAGNGWVEKIVNLGSGRSDLKIYDETLALIGLKFTNTSSDFKVLIGEVSLYRGVSPTPAAPEIEKSKIMACTYKGVDMKVIFNMVSSKAAPVYNSDVNTWYYKIYTQQEGKDPVMFTATTSWASYVVNAPYDYTNGTVDKIRIGVSAVSMDGRSESPITWSDYMTMPEPSVVEGLTIDKPIIKANEEFTLSYVDPNHAPANWQILNSATGDIVYSENNVSKMTISLPEEGSYDVVVIVDGSYAYNRGLIQVSPAETGALPILESVSASKTDDVNVSENITLSYVTARLGEGRVSRAIKVEDPMLLRFPEIVAQRPYTYMMWFKAEKFLHSNQGTNLIDKRSFSDVWPHNNWGDFWVTVRPECTANKEYSSGSTTAYMTHSANEISFNTYGWTEHDNPNHDMMSTGYSVDPGQWTHVAVTCDASNNQKIYFNGKLVASAKVLHDNNNGVRRAGSSIYVGGTSTYKAGFTGWVDEFQIWDRVLSDAEVLTAMKGFESAPDGLMGYWTFEDMVQDSEGQNVFPNLGKKGTQYYAEYITTQGQKGEDTQEVVQTVISASNSELGNPAITGTMNISTSATWDLNGGTLINTSGTAESGTATVSYDASGKYTPKLTLENMWGSDSKSIEYITVIDPSGIEDIEAVETLGVYPNPFTDYVNLMFAKAGTYTVQIVAMDGKLIENKKLVVNDNEGVRVDVNGSKGTYIIRIINADNVAVRTLTVLKK